jgi:gamma-glutamylcyclotransferase (GGCT)/AIG2-like uncharacterized protein YtfP
MNNVTVWYFAYGSNMSREQVRHRAGEPAEEKTARLENFELNFNKIARGGSGTAHIVAAEGRVVHGVLYRLTEAQLKKLDRFEGVPEHYRRSEVNVLDADGKRIAAQVYLARKVRRGLKPERAYLQRILEGATEHELPDDYIEQLKKFLG